MADMFTRKKRSSIMASIRSKGNRTTEIRFIRMMRVSGISGWRRGSKLEGRPDFVFSTEKLAVFIDGDFWHGNPKRFRLPKSNLAYWRAKIAANIRRDKTVRRILRALGWDVIRIWESSLRDENAVMAVLKIRLAALRTKASRRPQKTCRKFKTASSSRFFA